MENKTQERIHLEKGIPRPHDYHCDCSFCKKFLGILIRPDGTYYNKLERNKYYSDRDQKHIAKTPLHMARYCIQQYSEPGDYVLDPTMGAGTTAVEAANHGRNIAGMELEFIDVIRGNLKAQNPLVEIDIREGDARDLPDFGTPFSLIINNPPYSGDEQQVGNIKNGKTKSLLYDKDLPNLAFLKEGNQYYSTMDQIYKKAIDQLEIGGHFCVGVKDMVKNKKPYLLHKYLGEILESYLQFRGMILLPHYPPTLFMSTYNKRFPDVKVPRYQIILVFRKIK